MVEEELEKLRDSQRSREVSCTQHDFLYSHKLTILMMLHYRNL